MLVQITDNIAAYPEYLLRQIILPLLVGNLTFMIHPYNVEEFNNALQCRLEYAVKVFACIR